MKAQDHSEKIQETLVQIVPKVSLIPQCTRITNVIQFSFEPIA